MSVLDEKFKILKKIFTNGVTLFAFTRYLASGLSFVSSIFIAVKLGPYYFGLWGFILLLFSYFKFLNFGIPNAALVLLVQNKDDKNETTRNESASLLVTILLSLFVIVFAIGCTIFKPPVLEKFDIDSYLFPITFTIVLVNFNELFKNVYRAKGRIFEFGFYTSCIQFFVFIVMFFFRDEKLLFALILSYLSGNLVSLLLFVFNGKINFSRRVELKNFKTIIYKGFPLFVYSASFYFILLSSKSIVGGYYSVEQFGKFTFALTISNVVILLLDAFATLFFPKLIDLFSLKRIKELKENISNVYNVYSFLANFLISIFYFICPILFSFFKEYEDSVLICNLMLVATAILSLAFPFSTFMMANNYEKKLSVIAFSSLVINILLSLLCIWLELPYFSLVIVLYISYLIFVLFCMFSFAKVVDGSYFANKIVYSFFPIRIIIPLILEVVLSFTGNYLLYAIPFILFVILNYNEIRRIVKMIYDFFDQKKFSTI